MGNEKLIDTQIAQITGLETYKALYNAYPELYTAISYPMTSTAYFTTLVLGVTADSGLSYGYAGLKIRNILVELAGGKSIDDLSVTDKTLITPLIDSSYSIKYLSNTPWENFAWIAVTVFLSFFIIWYMYAIGFWSFAFNQYDGLTCYYCPSIFDKF